MTQQSTPRPIWFKPLIAVLGTAGLLAVLVIAFALPASRSAPHDVPIGVVGTPQHVAAFEQGIAVTAPGAFSTQIFVSEDVARAAIEQRIVYGALVLDSPTDVDVLYATAASPAVAALISATGQHLAQATNRQPHLIDVRAFPARDPKGVGLAAGALPLALGGWAGAMIIILLVSDPRWRILAALGVAVVGGLVVVGCLQFVIGTFDGNFGLTALAGIFGIAATCFMVLGLRELLGGAGLALAGVLLILLGNPLSGLASAPEMLPQPWGNVGQSLPPGATGALMREVSFFNGYGASRPVITLASYLAIGLALYVLARARAQVKDTVDVDRIEFDHRPRETAEPEQSGERESAAKAESVPEAESAAKAEQPEDGAHTTRLPPPADPPTEPIRRAPERYVSAEYDAHS
jgi:hypothetical protein